MVVEEHQTFFVTPDILRWSHLLWCVLLAEKGPILFKIDAQTKVQPFGSGIHFMETLKGNIFWNNYLGDNKLLQ